jgi:hypothetical protein
MFPEASSLEFNCAGRRVEQPRIAVPVIHAHREARIAAGETLDGRNGLGA